MKLHHIGIDCSPGRPRPDIHLPGVLKDTGLDLGEPVSKSFGAWEWSVPAEQSDAFVKAHSIIVERLTSLYNDGWIRGAVWSKLDKKVV